MRNGIKDLVPESVKTADQLINEFSCVRHTVESGIDLLT